MLSVSFVFGQQIQYRSVVAENDFTHNPGMTALGSYTKLGTFYRKQWVNFSGAPRTYGIAGEVPFSSEKVSLGGFIRVDEAGAFKSEEYSLSFNYKTKIGICWDDQLSIGLSGGVNVLQFDASHIIAQSPSDPLTLDFVGESRDPMFGIGFFYTTDRDMFTRDDKAHFFGAAINRLIPFQTSLLKGEDYKQSIHANAIIGGLAVNNYYFLKYECWIEYAPNTPIHIAGSLTGGYDKYLIGFTYKTDSTMSLFLGGELKGFKIGLSANFDIGTYQRQRGASLEAVLSYAFEMD